MAYQRQDTVFVHRLTLSSLCLVLSVLMLCISLPASAESRYEKSTEDETLEDLDVKESFGTDRFTGPEPEDLEVVSPMNDPFQDGKFGYERNRNGRQMSLSLLGHTPLILENTFDKRFAAGGASLLFSIELNRLAGGTLHGELGIGFTLSNLSLSAPSLTFSHVYLNLPLRLRWTTALNSTIDIEIIGGLQAKLYEYSSLPTGGWSAVSIFDELDPVLGLGGRIALSDTFDVRATLGLLYLSAGIEWRLDS